VPYIVYDFEATGTDVRHDQPTQFAAVLYDDDFKEIDSINVRAKPMHGVIPAPGAIATTGITGPELEAVESTHYEMMRKVREWIDERSPAQIMGKNSVAFDEEMMRSSYFKTLQPLYQTINGGNMRGDVQNMFEAFAILRPELVKVAVKPNGRMNTKLLSIANENGVTFDADSAHDALADVRATAMVMKMLHDKDPEFFAQQMANMDREKVQAMLEENPVTVDAQNYFGRFYSYPLSQLAQNPEYPAENAMFDLNFEPEKIIDMSADELVATMRGRPKMIRRVRTNGHPSIAPLDGVSEEGMKDVGDPELLKQRAAQIREALATHPTFKANLEEALKMTMESDLERPYVEERIYPSNPSQGDLDLMEAFHNTPWESRWELVGRFENADYAEIAREILFDQDPALLPPEMQQEEIEKTNERFAKRFRKGERGPRSLQSAMVDGEGYLAKLDRDTEGAVLKAKTEAERKEIETEARQHRDLAMDSMEWIQQRYGKGLEVKTVPQRTAPEKTAKAGKGKAWNGALKRKAEEHLTETEAELEEAQDHVRELEDQLEEAREELDAAQEAHDEAQQALDDLAEQEPKAAKGKAAKGKATKTKAAADTAKVDETPAPAAQKPKRAARQDYSWKL